jgi:hypothetical protein
VTIALADVRRGALDAIDRWVNVEPTDEGVPQRTVELLAERFERLAGVAVRRPGCPEIAAGAPASEGAARFPIRFGEQVVGELVAEPAAGPLDEEERAFLEHVARMVSSRCRA